MKAIIIDNDRKAAIVDRPVQKMRAGYVRIKTVAFAVNPSELSPPAHLEIGVIA